ncbi:MAG: hypothetical protein ACKVPJ_13435 [Chitinophagales bacterium]
MKKILLFLLLSPFLSYSQFIGFNGAGFFENQTAQSDAWLQDAVGNEAFTLRVPGGAIVKFADPLAAGGWGITHASIDSILEKYGSDEEEELSGANEKWKRKADEQPATSYLNNVIAMQKKYPHMRVIYCCNVFISPEAALYPVDYLLSNGVNVVGVELGNETYSQFNHIFDDYRKRTEPLAELLRFKGITVYHPVPATGVRTSKKHEAWIAALKAVIDVRDGVVFHPYYDAREFPALKQPVDTAAAFSQIQNWDFDDQFKKMKAQFPNIKKFIVTECNSQPSALIGNTELNAFLVSRLFEAGKNNFSDFCLHSGVAPDKYGMIYGTERKTGQKRNTSYFSFLQQLNAVPSETDTIIENCRDTSYVSYYSPVITQVNNYDTVCIKRFLRKKMCFVYVADVSYDTIYKPIYETKQICDTTIFIPSDTIPDEPTDTIPGNTGTCPATYNLDNEYCNSGRNDDYLHDERFLNPDGSLKCEDPVVEFDHQIYPKFEKTVIPDLAAQTGITIDVDNINFYITNPNTGEVAVFVDIFNWCKNGKRYIFNTNKELAAIWPEFKGQRSVVFPVEMIDMETGISVSILFRDHKTMTLTMTGL